MNAQANDSFDPDPESALHDPRGDAESGASVSVTGSAPDTVDDLREASIDARLAHLSGELVGVELLSTVERCADKARELRKEIKAKPDSEEKIGNLKFLHGIFDQIALARIRFVGRGNIRTVLN